MELVWPMIIERFPMLLEITNWLEIQVFDKICLGMPVDVGVIPLEDAKPIYQMMLDAAGTADIPMMGT